MLRLVCMFLEYSVADPKSHFDKMIYQLFYTEWFFFCMKRWVFFEPMIVRGRGALEV